MRTLRQARFLVRLVLAWFALSIGVAVASPLINPQALDVVCSAAGVVKLVVTSEGGSDERSAHLFDCPLCVQIGSPPAISQAGAQPPHPLSHALRPVVAAHLATLTGAPLPARGPPASL